MMIPVALSNLMSFGVPVFRQDFVTCIQARLLTTVAHSEVERHATFSISL